MAVRQTVVSNTNSPKTLTFNKLRGVDYSSSPFEVSTSRATSMKNMINEDGVNHKRHGWTEDTQHSKIVYELAFEQLLNACDVTLSIPGENDFLEAYLYVGIKNNKVCAKLVEKTHKDSLYIPDVLEYDVESAEYNIEVFANNGCVYLLGCGAFNRISIQEYNIDGMRYQISLDTHTDFAYAPKTSISINNKYEIDSSESSYAALESANVLTSKRKNSFIVGEQARIYNIAIEVPAIFKDNYKKIIYKFINLSTNEVVETDASGKTYAVSQLQEGSYKFRIICDDTEQTIFKSDDFKPGIAKINEQQINVYDTQYYLLYAFRNNATITVNGTQYDNPSMYVYSDIATQHYQIIKWYDDYDIESQIQIAQRADFVTGVGYSPNYSYFNNTVYEFDTKAKDNSLINITLCSKYNLKTQKYENDYIEYKTTRGVTNTYNKLKITYDSNEYFVGFINRERIIFIDNKLSAYSQGVDNMIVEFEGEDETYTNLIKNCKYGKSFALSGYNDRLFVYGNKNNPATMYFTGNGDFSYFPFTNFNVIGSNTNAISGISVLNDSTIAVHKKNDYKEASIYYLTAENVTIDNKNNAAFITSVGTLGETPVNPYVCANLAGDNLILSKTGVYSIQTGSNIKVSERYAYERSGFINSALEKLSDISDSKAISYDNRYYLSIADQVFIADARFKTSARDEDMNDTFNYEWWHWDNMPVKKWIILDGKISFITKNNLIASLSENHTDEKLVLMSAGDWTDVEVSDNYIQFNGVRKELLKNGNKLLVGDTYYEITDVNIYNYTFRLKNIYGDIVNTQGEFYSNFNKSFYIIDIYNVVGEWVTPLLNMGTSIYSKNLLSSTLTFEPNVEGNVKFGYTTRRSADPKYKDSNLSVANGVDFDNLDFTDFSFNVNFACSRTLKTRVRNYNYIQFRVISEDGKDFALNNFVVTYNYGRKNKGVR